MFCERLDNESFCESVIRELSELVEVRPCGPGWPVDRLEDVDRDGATFFLELDAASGRFVRPESLDTIEVPKFAWLVDTHKKPEFHRTIARQMDLTFHAMKTWGHVLEGPALWLPLHADGDVFRPVERERDLDVVFVGSQTWRADAVRRLGEKHGLRVHVETTTGPREKSETAALYARTRVVFNRHCANDLNFRVFEALACGRVLLTDAQPNGQYELFEDGKHLVLYKDDRNLEARLLDVLADAAWRDRIEAEAAAIAHARHTTRARVRQLHAAIKAFLAGRDAAVALDLAAPTTPPAPERLLFFTGDAAPGGYAMRLAATLASSGHTVTTLRDETLVPGAVPTAATETNTALARATALHAKLDTVAREAKPDAIVAEGAFGALVAAPVAERLGKPFWLALERCEVARRENRLTRDQLYLAELEHWGVERAATVFVPSERDRQDVTRHYGASHTRVVPAPGRPGPSSEEAEPLVTALGLARPFVTVLADELSERDARALLEAEGPDAVLATTRDVYVRRGDAVERATGVAPIGAVLAALLSAADAVVALDRGDPRLAEAERLARRLAVASGGARSDGIAALARQATPPRASR